MKFLMKTVKKQKNVPPVHPVQVEACGKKMHLSDAFVWTSLI